MLACLRTMLVCLVSLLFAGGSLAAQAGKPSLPDYLVLAKPQAVTPGPRVEVIEFFGYFCPHCNAFEPRLHAWVAQQGGRIEFKRMHIVFRPSMQMFRQMVITLEEMGQLEAVHQRLFQAYHVDRRPLDTETQLVDFLVSLGIDRAAYLETANSFKVQTKIYRQDALQEAFDIAVTPTVVIDGRFLSSPELLRQKVEAAGGDAAAQTDAALQTSLLRIMDGLVQKASLARKSKQVAK